jgi:hypothetical protein
VRLHDAKDVWLKKMRDTGFAAIIIYHLGFFILEMRNQGPRLVASTLCLNPDVQRVEAFDHDDLLIMNIV